MEIPDLQKYKDKFSQQNFIEKIQRIAKRAGAKLVYIALILYYLISPIDVVPDAIPIAGLADDLAVLLYALGKVWSQVDDNLKDKAKQKLSKWFDEDELNFSEDPFAEDDTNVPV